MKSLLPLFVVAYIIAAPVRTPAQVVAPNTIYFEFLGNGLGFSLNYDRRVADNFSVRGGIGNLTYASSDGSTISVVTVPLLGNYLLNFGSSNVQLGLGIMFLTGTLGDRYSGSSSGSGVSMTAAIGYRYQPKEGGVMFEVGFTPFLVLGYGVVPYVGLGLGYTF